MPSRDQSVSPRVGIFTDYIGTFGRSVLLGAADFANDHTDWSLTTLRMWHFDSVPPLEKIPVEAIITSVITEPLLEHIKKHCIPVVNVSSAHQGKGGLPSVLVDSAAIGKMGADFFLARGFRHFAFVGWPEFAYARDRAAAFTQAITAAGHTCAFCSSLPDDIAAFLPVQPKPLAVMASNDAGAIDVLSACQTLGLEVPESVAILGVDNDDLLTAITRPRLASVVTPAYSVGQAAASLLQALIRGDEPPSEPILLPPTRIEVRPSADIFAVADPDVAEALRYIRENAAKPLRVENLLADLTLSRRTLERKFIAAIGRTPLEEIHRVRLDRVRQLLIDTDMSIPNVATSAGFTDDTRLNVLFRRATGMTPTAYRKAFRPVSRSQTTGK